MGQDSSSTPESPGSTRYSQEWNRNERNTNLGSYSVQPATGNRDIGENILEVSQIRLPQETVNTYERFFRM